MSAERPDPAQGVYETLLVADGRVHALDAHLERLERSVRALYGLSVAPGDRSRIVERLTRSAVQATGEQRARIEAAARDGRLELGISTAGLPDRRPVALSPVTVPGGIGSHKWRDRRLIDSHGADPVPLILDADGSVLEAGWANVWLLDGERLITPPADGRLLPGITRARLLALGPSLGLDVRQQPITLADVRASPIVVLTSSLRLAVPAALGSPPPPSPDVDRIRAALLSS